MQEAESGFVPRGSGASHDTANCKDEIRIVQQWTIYHLRFVLYGYFSFVVVRLQGLFSLGFFDRMAGLGGEVVRRWLCVTNTLGGRVI